MTTITELKAAEMIGVPRQTLASWRTKKLLDEGVVVTPKFSPPPGVGVRVWYDESRMQEALAETRSIFAAKAP